MGPSSDSDWVRDDLLACCLFAVGVASSRSVVWLGYVVVYESKRAGIPAEGRRILFDGGAVVSTMVGRVQ